eukprot:CAMPEP_0171139528 /NCGR_PEP_ID=MMETSP0766_2-20121228/137028_1 /TAXON_ID=439317 /ORGANISM="Gambierdiscus australes, Strain CAWD 149" /LENGTH=64 /DNA_ID=CAMNT_0011603191 /DNA_START=73 /DNA_END=267 /DNA_ORIENTATION=-
MAASRACKGGGQAVSPWHGGVRGCMGVGGLSNFWLTRGLEALGHTPTLPQNWGAAGDMVRRSTM